MDDLVERLRNYRGGDIEWRNLMNVAAERIEKLEEVLKRLLETTANNAIYHSTDHAEARAVARATLSDNRGVTK